MAFLGLMVAIAFVVLAVCKVGNVGDIGGWSWWWVSAPLWGSTVLYWGFFLVCFILGTIFSKKTG